MSVKLVRPPRLEVAFKRLYDEGLPPGDMPGWPEVDALYSIAAGMITIITGWPGAGKSEWLDAVLLNLVPKGWLFAIFSPENQPIEMHLAKWVEKYQRKPFGRGPTERMTWEEAKEGMFELADHFSFITPKSDDDALSPIQILEAASILFDDDYSEKKRGLVIDPWSQLAHDWPQHTSETKYIGDTLAMIRRWAKARKVHVFLVAHPQKVPRENGKLPIPRLDMISGSQHWWNTADCGICVHRDFADYARPEVDIHVQKIRWKHHGRPGVATLNYDKVTGRYHPALRSVDFDPKR